MARVFELRTYRAHPGKFGEMSERFRSGTAALLEKHGMDVIGFFVPSDPGPDDPGTLIYLLGFESRAAATAAWDAFRADPEWNELRARSEENGPLVAHVDSVFCDPTDYSHLA